MKIQCNVCGVAEANLLCCADEAALCRDCDQIVHAANKLAGKHQRVQLSNSSSQKPKCDICQETTGYFFCLEDRALLCRKCDFSIHTANTLVSRHQRFLLTGVKVGLEATEPGSSSSSGRTHSHSNEKISGAETRPPTEGTTPISSSGQHSKHLPVQASMVGGISSADLPFTGGSAAGSTSQWLLDEFLGFGDYNKNYNFMDNSSSMFFIKHHTWKKCGTFLQYQQRSDLICLWKNSSRETQTTLQSYKPLIKNLRATSVLHRLQIHSGQCRRFFLHPQHLGSTDLRILIVSLTLLLPTCPT